MNDTDRDQPLAPTVVRASAGTGKTYQLTARLLRVLLQGAEPDSVLATTFTRKAAGEILDRLLVALADAADQANPEALEALARQVGIPDLRREACVTLLRRLISQIHRLRVNTLDSLFSQLARALPFELGLPPAWRLTDEIEEAWLTERAVEEVIRGLRPAETTTLLAMLGKGEVKRSIARELISVVTGTYARQRQCDGDVWDRLSVPKQPESADVTRVAGHFFQTDLPQKSLVKKLAGLAETLERREYTSLPDDTLVANVAKARRSGEPVKYGQAKFPPAFDEDFDVLYGVARHHALALLRAQNVATGSLLQTYHQHATRLKESLRTFGFDDVAARLAAHVASQDPEAFRARLDTDITHVLLDEFQDTSPIQWQVLRPFAIHAAKPAEPDKQAKPAEPGKQAESGPSATRSFFCVGDTKQAIYGWRGGVAEIFDAVAEQLDGVETREQNTSYRSSPTVLGFVNDVFRNLTRHPIASSGTGSADDKATHEADAVRRFAKRFPEHRAHHDRLPGYVHFETAKAGGKGRDEEQAATLEAAAERIAAIRRQAPGRSIGVLTRTNRCVARLIFLLDSRGLPVSQEGGNPLTDSAAVEVVLSALMLSEHPGDGRWKCHLASTPLADEFDLGDDDPPSRAAAQIRRRIDELGLTETVESLASRLAPICDDRDTERLRQLVQLAMGYEPNATPRVRDFVRLVRDKRVERPRAAAIRVMTVHQAKGLEFDAVVLPELDASLVRGGGGSVADVRRLGDPPQAMSRYLSNRGWHFLPTRWQHVFGKQAADAVTESLCLLYVALTRARYGLYLVIPPARKPDFTTRTPASLIFHALAAPADPTAGSTELYATGTPDWHARLDPVEPPQSPGIDRTDLGKDSAGKESIGEHSIENGESPRQASPQVIRFRPLPESPSRNAGGG